MVDLAATFCLIRCLFDGMKIELKNRNLSSKIKENFEHKIFFDGKMRRLTVAIFLDVKLEFYTVTVRMYISVRDAIFLAREFILLARRQYIQNY